MTEHENGEPENLTLRLLREMREENAAFRQEVAQDREENAKRFDKIDERFDRLEANSKTQAELLGKVMDAVLKIAETQQIHGNRLIAIDERLITVEGRMNSVERRLARIEDHTGLVKA